MCNSCKKEVESNKHKQTRVRALNEWEEMKLGFYRNEKSWEDNIRSRKVVEKNGQKFSVYKTSTGSERVLPVAPKNTWSPVTGKSK